ncbi:MAG TPA: zinc-binding dehydrogenase [Burkholderiaceae bacterium]|nr:zinc-binding dehydrogenase [Burkholderiaceae bacterium]
MDRLEFKAAVAADPSLAVTVQKLSADFGKPTDVLVRIDATSVCHTDYEAATGRLGLPFPFVPGHEAAGTVEAVGRAVERVRVGDRVVLSWNPACGTCFYCKRDTPILCEPYVRGFGSGTLLEGDTRLSRDKQAIGHLMFLASFAQYSIVSEQSAIAVPREMPPEKACMIGCAVATGYGAAERIAKIDPGDTVLVIGCGAVGLSAVQGARHAGAGCVIAADLDDRKLEMAGRFGADVTVDVRQRDLLTEVRARSAGRGADRVIESAGTESAFQASVEAVRPGGRVVWLGKLSANTPVSFRWGALMGEKRIRRSSYGGTRAREDFPRLARMYLDGKLALDPMVERVGTLDDAAGFLDAIGEGKVLRNVIRPNG